MNRKLHISTHIHTVKQVRQQDAYLAIRPAYPRGCCPRAAKGDKTSATSVSTQLIFGVDLLTFRPDIAYK